MNKLYFNNKEAYKDLNLLIMNAIEYPFIKEEKEVVEVNGRNEGSLTIATGNYKDLVIPVTFKMYKTDNYKNRIREITMWLTDIRDNILSFEDYREKCYKVKKIDISNIYDVNFTSAIFTINFICNPFIYRSREIPIVVNNNSDLYYDGDIKAEPNIILELPSNEQNISIIINDREFRFEKVKERIEIISSKMLVLDKNKGSLSNKMVGNFPILDLGINKIKWTGTINRFEINKNTIYRG